MRDLPARPIARPLTRLLAALAVAIGLAWVPIATVDACMCNFPGYPDALATSEVAFIGTMTGTGVTETRGGGPHTTEVAFDVERGKAELETPIVVDVTLGSEGYCGLPAAVGKRWLVIAHMVDGRPKTNHCSGSKVLARLDLATLHLAEAALEVEPVPSSGPNDPLAAARYGRLLSSIPVPVLLGGAVVVVAAVTAVTFRRKQPA